MDPKSLLCQGNDLLDQSRYVEALALYRQAAEGFREVADLNGEVLSGCQITQSLCLLHRLDEAELEARRSAAFAKDETASLDPLTRCNAFLSLGNVLSVRGKYAEAEEWLEKAARLAEDETAPLDSLTRCNAFTSFGNVLSVRGKYAEAEGWLEKAARLAENETVPLSPLTRCYTFVSLGDVLGVRGKYEEAEGWLEKAARLAEDETAPLTRCNAFTSFGNALSVRGKTDEAEKWLKGAARLAEDKTAPLDPLTRCNAFRSLGDVLRVRGKYEEAEGWLEKAARLAEDETAPLDPLTRCNVFRSLGNVLSVRGKDVEAEEWIEGAARLADDETAPLDPLTRCNAFMSLGNVLSVRGKDDEAEGWLEKAARLAEDETAPLDPLTRCNAFISLGDVLRVRGKYEEAEGWLEKAARLAEDETAPLDPLTRCNAFRSLGDVLRVRGKYDEAEGWLEKAARLADDETAPLDPLTRCNAFRSLGDVLRVRGKYDEAEGWLEKAARLADDETALLDPLTRLNVDGSLGELLAMQRRWKESLERLTRAREALAEILGSNRWPDATNNYLAMYGNLLEVGWRVATVLWRQTGDRAYLRQMLTFLEGRKCVAIREGLRRHGGRRPRRDDAELTWEYGPEEWPFGAYDPSSAERNSMTVEGVPSPTDEQTAGNTQILEIPGEEIDRIEKGFTQPITPSELAELLPDQNDVLLVYNFDGEDLVVLPIVRDSETGEPEVRHAQADLVRIERAHPKLEEHVKRHRRTRQRLLHGRHPDSTKPYILGTAEELHDWGHGWQEGISSELYELLGFDQVLSVIGREPGELHLTLLPDGLLFELPLHAAYSAERKTYLYEQVGSINYGLSLNTLYLQHKIEADARDREADQTELQGTVFANPERNDYENRLLHSIREALNLKEVMGQTHWRFYGEIPPNEASISHMNQWHGLGNLLWTIGHGGPMTSIIPTANGPVEIIRPSVKLSDGPLSTEQMALAGYDFQNVWLVHFSCCLLGEMSEADRGKQIEGFISGLTLLGARRVTSAMWELLDKAAAEFARHWMAALNRHVFTPNRQPHAFAIALKEALTAFRHADNGRYDHEVFWAPYTMYGPG